MTGYPSIDKPWLRHRPQKPIRDIKTDQKLWTLIESLNSGNLASNALWYLGIPGNTWTYQELFEQVDTLAQALFNWGIRAGDVVLVSTVSGPEEAVSLLALNKLGAISKWVDVTVSEAEIKAAAEENGCRAAVVFPVVLPELLKCIDKTELELVIYASPEQFIRMAKVLRASPLALAKTIASGKAPLPDMPKDSRFIAWKDFMRKGSGAKAYPASQYNPGSPAIIVQSSGTTGKPKSIVHSDKSINESIRKIVHTDLPMYQGLTLLKTAPSWVAYGLINALALGLAMGMEVLLTPSLNEGLLQELNGKYDVCDGVPLHYRYLSAHLAELGDMSRPKVLISGGDKISAQEISQFESEFAEKGCRARILNGAGCNEICGVGSVNFVNADKPGSIGLPLADDIVAAFNPDTGEEMPFNEVGEICYLTDSLFLEYAREPEMTSDVLKKHADGKLWMHSRDLGYIDEEGFIHLQGRMSRIITVAAFKISASHIEEILLSHARVRDCVVVGAPDDELGEIPVAFVELSAGDELAESLEQELSNLCKEHLKEKAVPKRYVFVEEIPYTTNNKQDYRELERRAAELVGGDAS